VTAMGALIFGTLGGLMFAGCAAVYVKQALLRDAQAHTDGHF
jgi:hypothetical protein